MIKQFNLPHLAAAGILAITAPCCFNGIPMLAQTAVAQSSTSQSSTDQTSGVSHPEDLPNDVNSPTPVQAFPSTGDHYVKPSTGDHYVEPSAGVASANDTATSTYRPYTPAASPQLTPRTAPATSETAADAPSFVVTDDVNSGVVLDVPSGPNELPIGTVLQAQLQSSVSTLETRVGAPFTATLTKEVSRHNVVLLPVGAIISGRVTRVRGGHAIGGPAAIRLQPDTVSLPDGTTYRLDADVIDLDDSANSHVNSEGTIVDNSHAKTTLAVLGGTTGVAAVSGAVVGGPVGAAVGATVGAGVGTIWWLRHDRQEMLPEGTSIDFSLNNSLQLTPQGK